MANNFLERNENVDYINVSQIIYLFSRSLSFFELEYKNVELF